MFFVQQQIFPDLPHLELPWTSPSNDWNKAFVWIKTYSPKDAVFALDANYITMAGEDSLNFRGISERSALPDYSKDGGIASIAPDLTAQWIDGQNIQTNLNHESDAQRLARLRASSVDWIVLSRATLTHFDCPYINATVQVCRVPSPGFFALAIHPVSSEPMVGPSLHWAVPRSPSVSFRIAGNTSTIGYPKEQREKLTLE
jgi:hypothetical protein